MSEDVKRTKDAAKLLLAEAKRATHLRQDQDLTPEIRQVRFHVKALAQNVFVNVLYRCKIILAQYVLF